MKLRMPIAPWIYVNDSTSATSEVATALEALIPRATVMPAQTDEPNFTKTCARIRNLNLRSLNPMESSWVWIFADNQTDPTAAYETAAKYHEGSINSGCNFLSVYVKARDPQVPQVTSLEKFGTKLTTDKWGTNHLELDIETARVKVGPVAEMIFQWLFRRLTVPEALHLIPEKDMLTVTDGTLPGYKYCPISEICKHPKNANIYMIVLVASKPQIGSDGLLRWRVVDRTGEASFTFMYRGPECKASWDWVLQFQPGDRKALPRMPMVQIKEKKRVKILKAPFRAVATVAQIGGWAIAEAGDGLMLIGDLLNMGHPDGKWVSRAEYQEGKKAKAKMLEDLKAAAAKKEIKIFNEKGERFWKEEDDEVSTTAGSLMDEKSENEFA
ncbi:MAG: hypothetical protein M1816_002039 [Peltula sp. TS41687]|nr:MAG: hypothetical protein M1816_002039 [Peltula sp. TS41687]